MEEHVVRREIYHADLNPVFESRAIPSCADYPEQPRNRHSPTVIVAAITRPKTKTADTCTDQWNQRN